VVVSFIVGGNQSPQINTRPVTSYWQTWSHNVVWNIPCHVWWVGFELTTLMMIGTDCRCSC